MSTVIHPYAKLRANVRLSTYFNTYLFHMHKFYYINLTNYYDSYTNQINLGFSILFFFIPSYFHGTK